jgi:hypothetical protein
MKKTVIILSILVVIASSCGRAKTQIENAGQPIPESIIQDTVIQFPVLLEYAADSTHIGQRGKNKVELSFYENADSAYVVIHFYSKSNKSQWILKQEFLFERGIVPDECDMQINDFNNDGLNDMTFVSMTAARGANNVRKLFIYDKHADTLICMKNSEDYCNILYNSQLNCITDFLFYGCNSTEFLHIQGDSLKLFASVELCGDGTLTVSEYDKFDNQTIIKEEINNKFEQYTRFANYKPLKQ